MALRRYGVEEAHLEEIASKAAKASSMKGNAIELNHAELLAILREAL